MRTAQVVVCGAAVAVATTPGSDVMAEVTRNYDTTGAVQPLTPCDPASVTPELICNATGLIGETMSVFNNLTNAFTRDWTNAEPTDIFQTSKTYSAGTPCTADAGCAYHPWFQGSASQAQPWDIVGDNAADTSLVYQSCIVQWMVGADPAVTTTFASTTPAKNVLSIQDCQALCIGATDNDCDLWTFDTSVVNGVDPNCFLQTSGALDAALNAPLEDCSLAANDGSKWATCATDPAIKLCATASGTKISGRMLCDPTTTPTLAYLRSNAPACATAISTSTGATTDESNTVPNAAFAAIPVLGAASLMVAVTLYLF